MNITDHITKQKISSRGGGIEIDLTAYGYPGHFMSAYQNYLGGGLLGAVTNDSTIKTWPEDKKLVRIAKELTDHYKTISGTGDEADGRPIAAY